jgi:ketosteroid isomerase-like protein
MMQPWEIVLKRFLEFGGAPTTARYLAQFDPEATLRHPGMAAPVGLGGIAQFIERSLEQFPDYRHTAVYWAVNGDTLFVETVCSVVAQGRLFAWPAMQHITIRGERIVRGHSHYDRSEMLPPTDPNSGRKDSNVHLSVLVGAIPRGAASTDDPAQVEKLYRQFVLPYVGNWKHPDPQRFNEFYAADARIINPGFERPIGPQELASLYATENAANPGTRRRLETWAVAGDLVFLQWTATWEVAGRVFELPVCERFTLRNGLAVQAVGYYDLITLAEMKASHQSGSAIGRR